jgi:hypothetical protein
MRSRSIHLAAVIATLSLAACGGSDVPASPDASHMIDANGCVPGAACDPFTNCGCDTASGQKCAEAASGNHCVAAGTKVVGDQCGNDGECVAGTVCFVSNGGLHCLAYCDDSHACPTDQACFIKVEDSMMNQIGMACGPTCNLLTQDCAGTGDACYSSGTVSTPEKGICVAAGTKMPGDTCMFGNDCAKGSTCINGTGTNPSVCRTYCDRSAGTNPCPSGQTCTALAGDTTTGICSP